MPEPTEPFRHLQIDAIRNAVAGTRFCEIDYRAETASTNDDAMAVLGHPRVGGTTIVVETQTAGKGRKAGRRWISPLGAGLTFTTILPTTIRPTDLWAVPFWTALCAADGIGRACGIAIELRWPNDLYVEGRKVGGILCVSRIVGEGASVACGVGINVNRPSDLPPIDPPPAYLSDLAPRHVRETILAEILLAFERRLPALHAPDAIARTYEERSGLIGSTYRVRVDLDGSEFEGPALGLGAEGTLRLNVAGTERVVSLADVRRL